MEESSEVTLRRLGPGDAAALSELLEAEPAEYRKYFHPFEFDLLTISQLLKKAVRDHFVGVEISGDAKNRLVGFYMLRGFDEGFAAPMYGVIIAHQYSRRGLGVLTLSHAEAFCRINNIGRLLLKVHPENRKARCLYEQHGFSFLRVDTTNENVVLEKQFQATE